MPAKYKPVFFPKLTKRAYEQREKSEYEKLQERNIKEKEDYLKKLQQVILYICYY